MIDLADRLLFPDGVTVIEDQKAAELLINNGCIDRGIKVIGTEDTTKFKNKYLIDIGFDTEINHDVMPTPTIEFDELEYDSLKLETYSDIRGDTDATLHKQRLDKEFSYIEQHDQQLFFIQTKHLTDSFNDDKVVWGVGRGSACASYVLFCLYVHDINPIKYNINPSEFYKHIEDL